MKQLHKDRYKVRIWSGSLVWASVAGKADGATVKHSHPMTACRDWVITGRGVEGGRGWIEIEESQ